MYKQKIECLKISCIIGRKIEIIQYNILSDLRSDRNINFTDLLRSTAPHRNPVYFMSNVNLYHIQITASQNQDSIPLSLKLVIGLDNSVYT